MWMIVSKNDFTLASLNLRLATCKWRLSYRGLGYTQTRKAEPRADYDAN